MSVNFHQFHIFYTVATLASFSKAARKLSISQPAVSIQVRELEKEMGSALLHRMRRGLQLTDTGQVVFAYAQRIFPLADEMQSAVHDIQGLRSGRLTIGSSTTPGEYILPWVIGQFHRRYPEVEISLSIANTQTIVSRIRNRELDLGMAGAPINLRDLATFSYVSDDIVVIAAPDHELAAKAGATLNDLEGQRFVLREQGSATRRAAEEFLAEHGIEIKVIMELGSNEAVKRAVAAGSGLGLISRFGTIADTKAGFIKVLAVNGWRCRRPLTVFHREDKHLSSAHRAFLRFLLEERPLPEPPPSPGP